MYGVEPMGTGTKLGENAASLSFGKAGVLHGFNSIMLQNEDGTPAPVHSIASGLDYPSVGPEHAYLNTIGRTKVATADDKETIQAFYDLSRYEGIIPALETAHAVAFAMKLAKEKPYESILVNLSGRGDKDIDFVVENFPLEDYL
jgi:tryptophan synthase beta chain